MGHAQGVARELHAWLVSRVGFSALPYEISYIGDVILPRWLHGVAPDPSPSCVGAMRRRGAGSGWVHMQLGCMA